MKLIGLTGCSEPDIFGFRWEESSQAVVAGVRRTFPKLQRLYLQTMLALRNVSQLALFAVEGTGQAWALHLRLTTTC